MSATDGFELKNDGTVLFQFDDNQTITLSRPKLGEYRKMAEALESTRSELRTAAVAAEDGEGEIKDPASVLDKVNDLLLDWFRLVFETIGSAPLPEEDDLPAWMLNGTLASELIGHWQKVPSRRGVR